jgi:hypothetical protein
VLEDEPDDDVLRIKASQRGPTKTGFAFQPRAAAAPEKEQHAAQL